MPEPLNIKVTRPVTTIVPYGSSRTLFAADQTLFFDGMSGPAFFNYPDENLPSHHPYLDVNHLSRRVVIISTLVDKCALEKWNKNGLFNEFIQNLKGTSPEQRDALYLPNPIQLENCLDDLLHQQSTAHLLCGFKAAALFNPQNKRLDLNWKKDLAELYESESKLTYQSSIVSELLLYQVIAQFSERLSYCKGRLSREERDSCQGSLIKALSHITKDPYFNKNESCLTLENLVPVPTPTEISADYLNLKSAMKSQPLGVAEIFNLLEKTISNLKFITAHVRLAAYIERSPRSQIEQLYGKYYQNSESDLSLKIDHIKKRAS